MKLLLAICLLVPTLVWGLEVDEKLTVRVLKTSESRKTLMINRGTEDGLVEGDHARLIVTAGVVARAVSIQVSPTRSVWSVYRLVNADLIVNDAVMTLKITPPVKLTKDESQKLVEEDVPTRAANEPVALGIPLAEGAEDLDSAPVASTVDAAELASLEETTIAQRNVEVFGNLNFAGLTAKTTGSGNVGSYSGSMANHHIGLGGEIYPRQEGKWFSRFSLLAGLNLIRSNSQAYDGTKTENDATEVELGVNWHLDRMPSATNHFIPFIHFGLGFGQAKSTYEGGPGVTGVGQSDDATGSTTSFSVGYGYKYYTRTGIGFRMMVDYYQRAEKYKADDSGASFDRTVNGPRFMFGMSYRF